jgi:ATP-dependent Clp protease ATP-binding subunit ClpX
MANKNTEICFLCGKTKMEVNRKLQGKFGCVCDECISDAYEHWKRM